MSLYLDGRHVSVTTKGVTETKFLSATFKATVITEGKTGPAAKELASPRIETIKKVIASHAEKGDIDTERLHTTFDVNTYTTYVQARQTHEFAGYRATYTIEFSARNVAHATTIHDAHASLLPSPQQPVFSLRTAGRTNTSCHCTA